MIFSEEDMAAWNDSEIMKEFEKIAIKTNIIDGPPIEAYQSINEEEEKTWEEEDEEKLLSAIEDLGIADEESENLKKELSKMYVANLITGLQKLAYNSAINYKTSVAYTIERSIMKIKTLQGR